jgi:transketolase
MPVATLRAIRGNEIRRIVLEQSYRAHVGHIGSALSIADILAVVFSDVLRNSSPDDPDRDRFILSKGHAALALYAALALRGTIPHAVLNRYCADNSQLGVHPERDLPGVDFSTGSLGQGLSIAAGAALAARMSRSNRRVVCLISDAECNEGSTWEAVMFAAHHRLDNLIAVVDDDAQQAFGYTRDVLSLEPLAERFRAFGWNVVEVDGNDERTLRSAFSNVLGSKGCAPHMLVAKTVFGKGVSFMESQIKWHYLPLNDQQFHDAMAEIA